MTNAAPAEKLTTVVNEEPVELFMSYGLLTRLLKMFDNEAQAMSFVFDGTARDNVLKEILTKRGKFGALEDVIPEDLMIGAEEVAKINGWVMEHLVDFFLRAGETMKGSLEKFGERSSALQLSAPGSTN